MTERKDLLTAQALAEALNLSVETIWKYTREGRIPYIKLGSKQYRYQLGAVVETLSGTAVHEKESSYKSGSENKLTYRDYLELPEEPGYRFEILKGILVKEPSPSVMHQRVSRRLQRLLEDYFWQTDPGGEIFGAPLDTTLGEETVVQPDLLYISGEQQEQIKETLIEGPPALVVEVISHTSSRKDRVQKMQIYQKAGVRHYWLADPADRTLECFSLQGSFYALVASGMDDDLIKHPEFEGLDLDLSILWRD